MSNIRTKRGIHGKRNRLVREKNERESSQFTKQDCLKSSHFNHDDFKHSFTIGKPVITVGGYFKQITTGN